MTSSASLQVKYHGGPYDGQYLYEIKDRQVSTEWHPVQGGRWVTTVYELPIGTEIEIIGKGRTGAQGRIRFDIHRIYRLDPQAEVLDTTLPLGLRACPLKGRLCLIRDRSSDKEQARTEFQTEDF